MWRRVNRKFSDISMDRAEAEALRRMGLACIRAGSTAGPREVSLRGWMQPKVSEGESWEKNDKGIRDKIAKSLQIWELNQRERKKAS